MPRHASREGPVAIVVVGDVHDRLTPLEDILGNEDPELWRVRKSPLWCRLAQERTPRYSLPRPSKSMEEMENALPHLITCRSCCRIRWIQQPVTAQPMTAPTRPAAADPRPKPIALPREMMPRGTSAVAFQRRFCRNTRQSAAWTVVPPHSGQLISAWCPAARRCNGHLSRPRAQRKVHSPHRAGGRKMVPDRTR